MFTYEPIDLNDYVRTGEGGTAVSYTHKSRPSLAKLYNPGFEADRSREEFLTARAVYDMGIPTPRPYRLVTDGTRYGAEYELIPGKRSFTRILSEEPQRLEELSREFARRARELHAKQADTALIHPYKEVLRQFYLEKKLVPDSFGRQCLAFLDTLPDTATCLHGDLHIGNIITDGQRTLWIDVGEFGYGVPEWDLSLMWTICNRMNEKRAMELFHVTPETLKAHWDIFLPVYLGTDDPQELEAFTRRLLPFYAIKVPYVYDMANHGALPAEFFQRFSPLLPKV